MNIQAMWSLANSILRDSRALLSWQLKELDLTPSEASIILHLHVHGAARIQDRLAEELDVSKPAISKAVDALEAKGFVERRHDPDNRRIRSIVLTPKAEAVADEVKRIYSDLYAAAAQGIDPDEVQSLIRLVERVAGNLRGYRELHLGPN